MEQNKQNSALLVMDIQPPTIQMLKEKDSYIALVNKAIENARNNNIPVIYVVVGFRKGYPEVSQNNKIFSGVKNRGFDNEEAMKVYSGINPKPDDIIVTKRRVSAFSGSDLEIILRAMDVKHIILTGIATSGVVLSTLREAADKDYQVTVLSDCCADADDEVHRVLTTKVFPRQAEVISVNEWE